MVIPLTWFLIFLNVNLTVLSFVGFGLIAFASIRFNRYIMDLGSHVNPIFGSFTETYLRSIRNRILLRIYGTTDDEVRECMRLSQDFRNKSALSIKWQASVSVLNNLIAPVWLLIILWAGVSYLSISTGMLLSFFYIFIRLASYLSSLASSFSAMVADIPAIQELTAAPWVIQEITRFHKPAECSKNRLVYNQKIYEGAVYLEKAEMKLEPVIIEARQLAVDYNGKVVFQDLNFSLSRGNCLGIIGPSGSGKSTFIAVITGLMLPAKGEVLIDNVYPGHDHFFKFRRHIGYVGPEPLLKQGTVYENLIYGLNESVDMDKIFKVLEDVQLQEISKLGKDGLEHRIYEGGEGLSSGQKQRLCLARALLREPRLLILDEATANLDESTESSIIEYLRHLKGRMTMIISSHRPQPLTLADMVIDLGNANQPIN
jgi:ABC-type multidrug transport system fused ATPase/permease subunit